MASRLLALLIAIATIVAPGSGAFGVATTATESHGGCCGDACECGDRCPCIERDDRPVRGEESPAAPADSRDGRLGSILLVLPNRAATLAAPGVCGRTCSSQAARAGDARAAGRALLAQVSRWTT